MNRKVGDRLIKQVREWRGRLLNTCAVIERDLGFALVEYFCSEERRARMLYTSLILKIPLSDRTEILKEIIKREAPLFNGVTGIDTLISDIKKVAKVRNDIAHNLLSTDESAHVDDGLSFVKYKNATEQPVHYSQAAFDDVNVRARMIVTCIGELRRLLPYQHADRQKESDAFDAQKWWGVG